MDEFKDFFPNVYTLIPKYDQTALTALLKGLVLPSLSDLDRLALDAKITAKEVVSAIFAFPPHRAPGPDGFPADFYKKYVDQLAPRLTALLVYCLQQQRLPDSIFEAYMIL